jgi:hypothetical protein
MQEYDRLKLVDNDFIADRLSKRNKTKLKLIQIFKSVACILYKDLMANPWKLMFYSGPIPGGGTICGTLTALFYMTGITHTGRKYRADFMNACQNPVNYKLYTDFMDVGLDGIDLKTPQLIKFMRKQGVAHLYNTLDQKLSTMREGCVKKFIRSKVRKFISKGELSDSKKYPQFKLKF